MQNMIDNKVERKNRKHLHQKALSEVYAIKTRNMEKNKKL